MTNQLVRERLILLHGRLQALSEQAGIDAHHVHPENDRRGDHFAEIEPPAGVVYRACGSEDDRAHEAEPDDRLDDSIENETHFLPLPSKLLIVPRTDN